MNKANKKSFVEQKNGSLKTNCADMVNDDEPSSEILEPSSEILQEFNWMDARFEKREGNAVFVSFGMNWSKVDLLESHVMAVPILEFTNLQNNTNEAHAIKVFDHQFKNRYELL